MLLWVTLGLMVVGIVVMAVSNNDHADTIGFWTFAVSGICLLFMLAILASNYIGLNATIACDEAQYGFLKYQYESDAYDSATKIAQYNLMQQIGEWNRDLAKNQKLTHDFWVGVFIPDYYDDLEYIEINFEEEHSHD